MVSKEITPPDINHMVREFCGLINAQSTPEYVRVASTDRSHPNDCFPNVKRQVALHGGSAVNGWSIWLWPNVMIEAECHCVWMSPENKMIDITPKSDLRILFLPDSTVNYTGKIIPNRRYPCTDSLLVAEFIKLANEKDRILSEPPSAQESELLLEQILMRLHEINQILHKIVSRNEPCPCRSGLKYKKCCGMNIERLKDD